jgi:hypothetical protein
LLEVSVTVDEPPVVQFLTTVHQSRTCLGLEALHRAHREELPHLRTVYRWHRRYGKQLSYFPTFSLEQLGGLIHLHLFITRPDPRWYQFPYAVESMWLTQNLVDPVLYLHCFVPFAHRANVEAFLKAVELPHSGLRVIWSSSGWQRLQLGDYESLSQGFPLHSWPIAHSGIVARSYALAIPMLGEAWNRRMSLAEVWRRIHARLGTGVKEYLPRQRFCPVNGKRHIKNTYRALLTDGVFRQYLIRYEDECAVLVVAPAYRRTVPSDVAQVTRTAELFPTSDGGGLWRLQGTYDLLRFRASLEGCAVYVVERQEPPAVRFCYEWLFRPVTSQWRFSARRIRRHMGLPDG